MAEPPRDAITVRVATPSDLPDIQAVAEQTWRATYAGHIPGADIAAFLTAAYNHEQLTRRLSLGLFVAVRGEDVIGYAQVGLNNENAAELFALYVLPAYQGIGAGWQLWQRALARVRELGRGQMLLWVLEANDVARRFYERQGARHVTERDFPVGGSTVTEVCYHMSIT